MAYTLDHTDPLNCSCGAKPVYDADCELRRGPIVKCTECVDVEYECYAQGQDRDDAWHMWHEMRIDELLTAEAKANRRPP